ncbi:hypothetical protein [Marinospirillum sp.]|uniref:hypothetical protein n=1 Tax=Marinospirillum sp. TaxID=2183934 RepID=UPI0025C39306|nr:hypothetical protein [Marinospirillum sp.]
MARVQDAKSTLQALARFGGEILEAHLRHGNRLAETDENHNMLQTLEHHRLVWRIGDAEDLQLKKVLVQFLDHITETERRRYANAQVSQLWQKLTDLFGDYKAAKKRSAFGDIDRLEGEIKECLAEVIEDIRNAIEAFGAYINTGFAYVTDAELRIRENKRVIEQADKLIQLFESFKLSELAEQAGSDAFLKRLLLRYLPATLESSQKDLSYSLNQLRKMLVRFRENQRLSKLVGAFEAHYINHPGFEPTIEHIDFARLPEAFNTVSPFTIRGFGDIYDPVDELAIIDLAANARTVGNSSEPEQTIETAVSVNFDVAGEVEIEDSDPVEEAIVELLQLVVDGALGEQTILASDALKSTGLAVERADWLQALAAEIDVLPDSDRECIEISFHDTPDPVYLDNLYVYDIALRYRHAQ